MNSPNPFYRQNSTTPFHRALTAELAAQFRKLVEAERVALAEPVDRLDTGHQAEPSPFMVPWNGDPDTNPLSDWLNEVLGTGVPVQINVGQFQDGTTWSFDLGRDPSDIRNVTVHGSGKSSAADTAALYTAPCPNGECEHPAANHDGQHEEDPRPNCAFEIDPATETFCPCAEEVTRDHVDQFAEYYMTGRGRFHWAEELRCEHGVRLVVPCADCPPLVGLTPDLVRQYPEYFVSGPGRERASKTLCRHEYYLTDSCPGCDHDREVDERIGTRPVTEWLPELIDDMVAARKRRGDDLSITLGDVVPYLPLKHQHAAADAFLTGAVLVTKVGEQNQGLVAAAQIVTPFKDGCPNNACEHPGLAHDVETLDDPLPLCGGRTADDKRCPCGTLTRAWVEAHPDYYVLGDGYDYASDKRCEHAVQLTEPCTACDADALAAKKVQS